MEQLLHHGRVAQVRLHRRGTAAGLGAGKGVLEVDLLATRRSSPILFPRRLSAQNT